jgi:hypothetical protein
VLLRDLELIILSISTTDDFKTSNTYIDLLLLDQDLYERLESSGNTESFIDLSLLPWIDRQNATLNSMPEDAFNLIV